MPSRFKIKNAKPDAPISISMVTMKPERSCANGKPPTFIPTIDGMTPAPELSAAPASLTSE
jgi:hypothetical protein